MNWGSTIPAAISALVTAFQEANPNVQVSDGPLLADESILESITVGFDGGDGKAAQAELMQDGWASGPAQEQYTVFCSCSALSGDPSDTAQSDVRATAFEILDNCSNALATDPTLGDVVLRALPRDVTVTQLKDTDGVACIIRFGVQIEAFTR